jgi:uncharacterized membrane protein
LIVLNLVLRTKLPPALLLFSFIFAVIASVVTAIIAPVVIRAFTVFVVEDEAGYWGSYSVEDFAELASGFYREAADFHDD